MKDDQSRTIIAGETVTLNETVRPMRLIGLKATVLRFGEKMLLVRINKTDFISEEEVRVLPSMVRIGEHSISAPITNRLLQQIRNAEGIVKVFENMFQDAVKRDIISKKQHDELLELFFFGNRNDAEH